MRTKGFKTLVALFMFMMISALPATTMNFLAQDSVPSINSSSSDYHELDNLSSDLLLAANYPGGLISMVEENSGDDMNVNSNNTNLVYPNQSEPGGSGNPNYTNSNLVYPYQVEKNNEDPLTLNATYGNESSSGMEKVAFSSSYDYPDVSYSFSAFLDRYTDNVSYLYSPSVAMDESSDDIVLLNGTYGNAPSYAVPESLNTVKDSFSGAYDSIKSTFDDISDAIYDMMPNN
jgi:hypothetical protein